MADSPEKTDTSAEKAYAAASSEVKKTPAPKASTASAPAEDKPAKVDVEAVKEAVAEAPKPAPAPAQSKPAKAKTVAKKPTPARKPAAKASAPKKAAKPAPVKSKTVAKKTSAAPKAKAVKKKPAPKKPIATKTTAPSITELKEKIMATKTTDLTSTFSKSMTDAVSDMQTKAQAAYDKSTVAMTEMTDLAKGNVEAIVESGKIVAGGMQDMGKTYADEAKTAYESMTADMKEMAAVKSPTELFQLQGKIMRRNFDAFVATASKNTESMMKLANDAAAPITGRMNVAAEKLSKVA